MPTVKLFTQAGCGRCPQARQAAAALGQEDGCRIIEFDIGTADGLAEAAYYSIQATPTIIIEDDTETVIGDFRGDVPPVQTLRQALGGS